MSESAIPAAVTAKNAALMRTAIVSELVPVIPAATNPTTWDPRELGTGGGAVWPAVIWQEKIWFRDPTDSTSAHDGISVIVTLDGSRYKTNDVEMPRAVLSRTVTAPPGAPALGDAYLVPGGATGVWAAHEDEVALYTARGWAYQIAERGHLLFIEAEGGYVHFNESDTWENGLGAYAFTDGIVHPRHLLIRDWNVENMTTNAPPAAGPAGEQYIIGPTPTGTWATHSKKIAYRPVLDGAFVILQPFSGEEIYDKATGIRYRWTGTSWASTAGAIVESGAVYTADVDPDTTLSTTAGVGHFIPELPLTLPQSTQWHVVDTDATFTIKSRRSGQRIRFMYSTNLLKYDNGPGSGSSGSLGGVVVALFRDSEVNALDWVYIDNAQTNVLYNRRAIFEITTDDTSSHVYKIRWMNYRSAGDNRGIAYAGARLEHRRFSYEMFS